jgi:outer membrane lipoprotein-sorting protein
MRGRIFVRYAAVAVCVLAIVSGQASAQQGWGIAQLMAALAQVRSASGQFTERKTMRMLTQPLILSGRLIYVAPSHIEKSTISPTSEKMVMDGDQITIVSGPNNETHTFSLAQYPQIGGLVEGIRATLAGDLSTLERFYALQIGGTAAAWDLRLMPRDTDLTHFVKWMEFRGSGDRIQTISTEDSDGDRSDMTIAEDRRDVR